MSFKALHQVVPIKAVMPSRLTAASRRAYHVEYKSAHASSSYPLGDPPFQLVEKKGESRIRTDVATREDEDPCKGLGFVRFPLSRRR